MHHPAISTFTAAQTAALLDFRELVDSLAVAVDDYAKAAITAPERQVVALPQGGVMLSMPAAARDIGIHKLVNVVPGNRARNLPTIHGIVSTFDGTTGRELFILDGPTVTARRTAAVSMLGLATFLERPPARVVLIGTGKQAAGHAEALASVFPDITVVVVGRDTAATSAFIRQLNHLPLRFEASQQMPAYADAVITLTTSKTPVYDAAAQVGRLVIGVGAFEADSAEIDARTIMASQVYVDDPAGARHEAGDVILAGLGWDAVKSLSQALTEGVDFDRPIVFKSVGCAAWDLAAARCARVAMESSGQRGAR